MGLPSITINFKEKGSTAIKRGEHGVVALVISDVSNGTGEVVHHTVNTITDIAGLGLTLENQKQIEFALMGYINPAKKVEVVVAENGAGDFVKSMAFLETIKWDYVAFPAITGIVGQEAAITTWVKGLRDIKRVKAVLPDHVADTEAVINFTTKDIKVGGETYSAAQYCSRIAGILAGTPMTMSATYAPLHEVLDCEKLNKTAMDTAINQGKLILLHDGEKVKIARAVNSLTTTNQDKGDSFKKIKLVDTMDMIRDDIKRTVEDSYLGKYGNSYDNKCVLITAIQGYLDQLSLDGILDNSFNNRVEIDVEKQRAYLKQIGTVGIDDMSDLEVKKYNTKDQVFLIAHIKMLDAIEDITLDIII